MSLIFIFARPNNRVWIFGGGATCSSFFSKIRKRHFEVSKKLDVDNIVFYQCVNFNSKLFIFGAAQKKVDRF
jgi:dihydrofolate reductase